MLKSNEAYKSVLSASIFKSSLRTLLHSSLNVYHQRYRLHPYTLPPVFSILPKKQFQ